MNTFVIEDFDVDEGNVCNIYTVAIEDDISETEKFYEKYDDPKSEYFDDFGKIDALLLYIANEGMRIIRRIRPERAVNAMPPKAIDSEYAIDILGISLRLYYLQISENVIILFGGGIAHEDRTGKIPIQFYDAQKFAKKILESIGTEFEVKGNKLFPTSNNIIRIF